MDEEKPLAQEKNKPSRHSGIDLLRVIAILLICFFHANQTFANTIGISQLDNFSKIITLGFIPFGTIGNVLFVICSSFFLADKTKTRTEKAIGLLFDSMLISICILFGFLISGESLSLKTIIYQITPDLFKNNWFVPCYVIFYILAPIVVLGLKQFSRKAHFGLVIFSFIVYGCLSMIDLAPVGSNLLQFFYVLNLTAFVKWHCPSVCINKKTNLIIAIIGIVITYIGHFGFALLAKYISFFGRIEFVNMYAPILVISLVCLFNAFKEMKFENKFFSYLSSCSLFVYVIHENYLLRRITRVSYYEWAVANYGISSGIVYVVACGVFMIVVSFVLAAIYKESLHRLTNKLACAINNFIGRIMDWLYLRLFKE